MPFADLYRNKRVWVSGSTGFKGAFLCAWLDMLGAKICGFALAEPPSVPSLFEQIRLRERITQETGDVRDLDAVRKSIEAFQPDFAFHMAAQALVRESYNQPVVTYATNVLGTAHVLEALRGLNKPCATVIITTDKCYENKEWPFGYREEDRLGGHDPYSSSKACAELVVSTYRKCFFQNHPVRIASARAGNVIGPDFGKDRLVPDCIRALVQGLPIPIRNPLATRPWQWVGECVGGYLWLGAVLANPSLRPGRGQGADKAFNFGPTIDSNRTVKELTETLLRAWGIGTWQDRSDPAAVHEAHLLHLSIDLAYQALGWKPTWGFEEAVQTTVEYYKEANKPDAAASSLLDLVRGQIGRYQDRARQLGIQWSI